MAHYYFDEKTLTYRSVRYWGPADLIPPMGRFRGTMLLIILTITAYAAALGYRQYLVVQQDVLVERLQTQHQQLATLELELEGLYAQDNDVYRSVLNAPMTDPAVWEGGTGGSEEQVRENPDIVRDLNHRLEKVAYKLHLEENSFAELDVLAEKKMAELRTIPVLMPVDRSVVSGFGHRCHPFHGGVHFHHGIDIAAPMGTPVRASADGVVAGSGYIECGYGIQVVLHHNGEYRTNYAHLSRTLVKHGQKVRRGDIVGYSGNTGYSTGPHLHYEVIHKGAKINPLAYCLVRNVKQLKS